MNSKMTHIAFQSDHNNKCNHALYVPRPKSLGYGFEQHEILLRKKFQNLNNHTLCVPMLKLFGHGFGSHEILLRRKNCTEIWTSRSGSNPLNQSHQNKIGFQTYLFWGKSQVGSSTQNELSPSPQCTRLWHTWAPRTTTTIIKSCALRAKTKNHLAMGLSRIKIFWVETLGQDPDQWAITRKQDWLLQPY